MTTHPPLMTRVPARRRSRSGAWPGFRNPRPHVQRGTGGLPGRRSAL